jgi:uncharacterized protein (TIGR02145 family)
MANKIIFWLLLFLVVGMVGKAQESTVTDIDGNVYNTVVIGNQTWMAENLRVTKLNDGKPLHLVTNKDENLNIYYYPAYCWYDYDSINYKFICGGFYNGFAIITDKLCPVGWHIPTHDECGKLVDQVMYNCPASVKLILL